MTKHIRTYDFVRPYVLLKTSLCVKANVLMREASRPYVLLA